MTVIEAYEHDCLPSLAADTVRFSQGERIFPGKPSLPLGETHARSAAVRVKWRGVLHKRTTISK
jgi:hypothetical protein